MERQFTPHGTLWMRVHDSAVRIANITDNTNWLMKPDVASTSNVDLTLKPKAPAELYEDPDLPDPSENDQPALKTVLCANVHAGDENPTVSVMCPEREDEVTPLEALARVPFLLDTFFIPA